MGTKKLRTQKEALLLAARTQEKLSVTGLKKVCPRCEREGWVFARGVDGFVVVWGGPPKGEISAGCDLDIITHDDLFSRSFGCGYDAPKRRM